MDVSCLGEKTSAVSLLISDIGRGRFPRFLHCDPVLSAGYFLDGFAWTTARSPAHDARPSQRLEADAGDPGRLCLLSRAMENGSIFDGAEIETVTIIPCA